jgi:hypothetical protein
MSVAARRGTFPEQETHADDGRDSQDSPPAPHLGVHPESLPDAAEAWPSRRVDRKIAS